MGFLRLATVATALPGFIRKHVLVSKHYTGYCEVMETQRELQVVIESVVVPDVNQRLTQAYALILRASTPIRRTPNSIASPREVRATSHAVLHKQA